MITNQKLEKSLWNPDFEMKETYIVNKVMNNHTIKIEDLNVYIDNQHILKDISLNIPEKSITCIIGPSGCGKSTLLKTLNRMHDDTPEVKISGKVIVDEENIYSPGVNVIDTRKKMGDHVHYQCQYLIMLHMAPEFTALKKEMQLIRL
jgi:phosphate transport system ATP-binding protein